MLFEKVHLLRPVLQIGFQIRHILAPEEAVSVDAASHLELVANPVVLYIEKWLQNEFTELLQAQVEEVCSHMRVRIK